ncbi:MAG: muconolactone Delta-isomerase family protein [Nitrospirota bacterium]
MMNKLLGGLTMAALLSAGTTPALADQFLVIASQGPSFASPAEALTVLEKTIVPTFDALLKLQADRKIVAGGLPVGDRAFAFILEAASNAEADEILRNIPAWPMLDWEVTPLQSFKARADKERSVVAELKKQQH